MNSKKKYILQVMVDILPEKEEEWNKWYNPGPYPVYPPLPRVLERPPLSRFSGKRTALHRHL